MLTWVQSLLGLMVAYCVACRANAKITGIVDQDIEPPGGRRRIRRGTCKTCGAATSQFVASS